MKLPAKFTIGTIQEYNRNTLIMRLFKIGIVALVIISILLLAYKFIIVAYENNKAKVECSPPQGYDISGGRLKLSNIGNLTASNIEVAWKIVKIESGKQSDISYSGNDEYKELPPGETWNISYYSKFRNDEQGLFMVVVWKYGGEGIKKHIFKHADYFWNTYWNPPAWAMTNRIDYQNQLSVVDNEIIPELKKRLGV